MDCIISAKNLVYNYSDESGGLNSDTAAAVNDVSFDIERGSFTAIIGHNGSGKSTLAKMLSGIYMPTSGSVSIFRKGSSHALDCSSEKDNFDIRKTVGMVFQNPDNQLVSTIVEDDVAFAPENLGMEPSKIRECVDEALKTVGLSEYSHHDTHKLSGGQKQRVAVAGILAMRPECIIFDESTAMLDPKGRSDIIDTILKLRDSGITVVLITHYMNEAALADRIIVVSEGKVIADSTPEKVFSQRKMLKDSGLEPPQSTLLVQKLSDCGFAIDTHIIDIDGAVKSIEDAFAKKGVEKSCVKGQYNA